jgi:H+/Cl- antiporter ClcA
MVLKNWKTISIKSLLLPFLAAVVAAVVADRLVDINILRILWNQILSFSNFLTNPISLPLWIILLFILSIFILGAYSFFKRKVVPYSINNFSPGWFNRNKNNINSVPLRSK